MRQYLTYEINKVPVAFEPREFAPMNEVELFNEPTLKIWTGSSGGTIWLDEKTNWKFRAIHDLCHLETRLDFSVQHEIELGKIQAAHFASQCKSLLADVVYCEIAGQAEHYLRTGQFVENQLQFTVNWLKETGSL